ncbi:MAG: bifunctional phosphopantothenoylcysteine decarboxylase/phosphopantothenate--cysteine ligase CoaBC [Gammaproteobacteria bacterium]|nr:bifunctional phosphopantothenoylcysteine decarboxylase/phosphopantothenate--cysteine ligase CoaBC [Gammaproteobacteria bacterium]
MSLLQNRRVLLGITGGIAAYKSADLVRRLQDQGAEVRVVMTRAATEFITPLTLQALSGHPVALDLLDPDTEAAMGHIELARWADFLLVAPATADFLARAVSGASDDLLTAVWRAAACPRAVAPAMNRQMWLDPATQRNVRQLSADGVARFGPDDGLQACGEIGPGRMLEPQALADQVAACFETGELVGASVLITAGPTYEDIDPVRFIGNRSSGRMGYAIAEAARDAGARVVLVSGPTALEPPDRVDFVQVRSAAQMFEAVQARVAAASIFIGSAAVADYRPERMIEHKLKRKGDPLTLKLVPNPDILAWVASRPGSPFTLGFAAETGDLLEYAHAKLKTKGIDLIAANLVGGETGFDSDENALILISASGETHELPRERKAKLAGQLVTCLARQYHGKHTA